MISAESDVRGHCFFTFQPVRPRLPYGACSPACLAHSGNTEVASPVVAPAKNAGRMHAYYARFQSPYTARDKPSASGSINPDREGW